MQCKFKQLLSFALLTQFKHKNKAFQKYIFWQLFRNFYAAAKNSKKIIYAFNIICGSHFCTPRKLYINVNPSKKFNRKSHHRRIIILEFYITSQIKRFICEVLHKRLLIAFKEYFNRIFSNEDL